jgi:hypothetical protein
MSGGYESNAVAPPWNGHGMEQTLAVMDWRRDALRVTLKKRYQGLV